LFDIVANPEAIAINQDPAGNQGVPYRNGDAMVVVKTLSGTGARAVALFNRGPKPVEASVSWAQLGFAAGSTAKVRDVWAHGDRDTNDKISVTLPAHGSVLLRVQGTPSNAAASFLANMPGRVNVAVDGLTQATALPMGQFPARIGAAPDGRILKTNAIGAFANSRLEVRADGAFHRFVTAPTVLSGRQSVRFRVYADRKLVKEIVGSAAQGAPPIDVDIASAKIVELVAITNAGNARPPMIAWGDARLVR
jgi:alpha-galactosidase